MATSLAPIPFPSLVQHAPTEPGSIVSSLEPRSSHEPVDEHRLPPRGLALAQAFAADSSALAAASTSAETLARPTKLRIDTFSPIEHRISPRTPRVRSTTGDNPSSSSSASRSPLAEIPTVEAQGSSTFDVAPLIAHLDAIALERGRRRRQRTLSSEHARSREGRASSPEAMLEFADYVSDSFRFDSGRPSANDDSNGGANYLTPVQRGSVQFPTDTVTSSPTFEVVPRTPRTSSLHATELERLVRSQSVGGHSIDLIDFNSPSRKSSVMVSSTPIEPSLVGTATRSSCELSPAPRTPTSTPSSASSRIPFPNASTLPSSSIDALGMNDHSSQASSSEEGHGSFAEEEEQVLEEDEEELSEDEEDEDPDSHPIYTLLATSSIPLLRSTWDAATLILVPPRRTLPPLAALTPRREATPAFEFVRGGKGVTGEQAGRDVEKERQSLTIYVALHAFKSIPSTDGGPITTWRSVIDSPTGYCRARLVPEQGIALVEWVGNGSASGAARIDPSGSDLSSVAMSTSTSSTTSPGLATSSSPDFGMTRRVSTDSEASDVLPHTPPLAEPTSILPPPTSFGQPTPARALRILAETTIYRRPRPIPLAKAPAAPPPVTAIAKSSTSSSLTKSAFRTPKWFRRSTSSVPTLKTLPEKIDPDANIPAPSIMDGSSSSLKSGPMLERVRVLALGGGVVTQVESILENSGTPRKISSVSRNSSEQQGVVRMSTSSSSLRQIPLSRAGSTTALRSRSQTSLLSRHPTFELPPYDGTSSHGGGTGRKRAGSIASTRSARSAKSTAGPMSLFMGGQASSALMRRDFLIDLAFLASPPSQLAGLAPALASALAQARALVRDVEGSVAYIRGLEAYLVQRIRKGIFDRVWQQLVRELDVEEDLRGWLVAEEHAANLRLLVENVIIGLLYRKLYTSSILPLYAQEDTTFNHIASVYRERQLSPLDFGVDLEQLGSGDVLDEAITILQDLKETSEVATMVQSEVVQTWVSSVTVDHRSITGRPDKPSPSISPAIDEVTATRPLRGVRTPLGCIAIIAASLQAMVYSIEALQAGSRLAPDDLIPLFAWVIVKSGVENLESLLFFVKTFRLSETMASHFDWSFVNFQASLAFLLSDPLHCLPEPPTSWTSGPGFANSSASSSPARRSSELPSYRTRRLSLQQYRPGHGNSPPTSPKSLRGIGAAWHSPATTTKASRNASTASPSSAWTSYARERRLSWQQVSKAPKRVSLTLDTELVPSVINPSSAASSSFPMPRFDRATSSEQMPPPSWTTPGSKRRMSLGIEGGSVSSAPRRDTPRSEVGEDMDPSAATQHLRALSLASLSSEGGGGGAAKYRPRVFLPSSGNLAAGHRNHERSVSPGSPSLSRSYSAVTARQTGGSSSPILAPADMRRSESEGSSVVSNRPYADRWSLWGALPSSTTAPSSHRAASPAFSETTSGEGAMSSDDQHSSSWWTWNRGGLSASVGATSPHLTARLGSAPLGTAAEGLNASSELRRLRRYSASAADILADRPAHLDHLPLPTSSSSARLAAILATKGSAPEMLPPTRPRPRSIMSVSSIGSNTSFVLSESEESTWNGPSSASGPALSTTSSPSMAPPPPRRPTRSRTWRELPTSNLAGAPLAPRLDSTSIVSIPRTTTSSMNSRSTTPDPGERRSRSPSRAPISRSFTPPSPPPAAPAIDVASPLTTLAMPLTT